MDIYDEQDGTWSGITQLLAGETPFVTDEDDSEDFFAPIRTQTGTLQVCTALPNGGRISLDELLPENNIARPIRLINLDNSNAIEWQGFLSCEAYSQNYTSIPENLSLPVISVLEAMDSVEVNIIRTNGLKKISELISDILTEIDIQSGVSNISNIYYSATSWSILDKYIDTTIMLKKDDYNNENEITYIISGLSCKEILSRICTFMGWVVREYKTDILLARLCEEIGMYKETAYDFKNNFHSNIQFIPISTPDIVDLVWMGNNHKREVRQGSKSVSVTANIEDYKLELNLHGCPRVSLVENPSARQNKWGLFYINSNRNSYSDSELRSVSTSVSIAETYGEDGLINILDSYSEIKYLDTIVFSDIQFYSDFDDIVDSEVAKYGLYTLFGVAFLCLAREAALAYTAEYLEGLMIIGTPQRLYLNSAGTNYIALEIPSGEIQQSDYIYKQRTILYFRASNGYICINIKASAILGTPLGFYEGLKKTHDVSLLIAIKFGDYWVHRNGNNYYFGNTFSTFKLDIDSNGIGPQNCPYIVDKESGLFIPISSSMNGEVTVYIYPIITGCCEQVPLGSRTPVTTVTGILLEEFSIEYKKEENVILSDDNKNSYFEKLLTNFRDEISVSTDIATSLNNRPSPSLVMESLYSDDATTKIDYVIDTIGTTEKRRPEVDLLNRLASYYGASRQTLNLIVKHPVINSQPAILPLLILNGIGDGKQYLPLAESRDWQEETSTLTCFETPQEEPSES